MIRSIRLLLGPLLLLATGGTAFGQNITGSAHDFSGEAWNTTGEICVVCHTPHFADISVTDAPLWNHQVTTAVYTIYGSATLDATDVGQPQGISLLCLSCHDGTVALDNFGGNTAGTNFIPVTANVGVDISDDHPLSFTFDDALASADGELATPSIDPSGLGGTIAADMLFNNQLECGTCHDVHDDTNNPFLRIDNAASALCLTCHNK